MAASLRLGTSSLRSVSLNSFAARNAAFTAARCYSSKTQVSYVASNSQHWRYPLTTVFGNRP